MSTLRLKISMSLDGFVAGPHQSVENPLGIGGMRLHDWVFPLEVWRSMHGLPGGVANESTAVVEESLTNIGRHRYEFNPEYREHLEAAGLVISGASPDGRLVEIVEVADHPWFVAAQFHPDFASTPFRPHPLFVDFVAAALRHAKGGA